MRVLSMGPLACAHSEGAGGPNTGRERVRNVGCPELEGKIARELSR